MKSKKRYTVSDGKLVLHMQPAEEGGYIVTSPLDPELITEAETLEEAFLITQAMRPKRSVNLGRNCYVYCLFHD